MADEQLREEQLAPTRLSSALTLNPTPTLTRNRIQGVGAAAARRLALACGAAWVVLITIPSRATAAADSGVDAAFFENRVRPIFAEHCYSCHSAKAEKVRGALKLDTREDFFKGGTAGAIVVPGRPEESRLIQAVRYEHEDLRMPPAKDGGQKLPALAIADLTEWVKHGAPYPETPAHLRTGPVKPWSFQPIQDPRAPEVKRTDWARTSIDPFIMERLEAQGRAPARPADRRTLLRRVTFDLTGLPPTPDEMDAFLADAAPDDQAFARVVDRLLASLHYGERWGRHWLDVVRYADTAGDTADYPLPLAWRYRNYVVDAFNADKPYDEFLREQIAGDILAKQGPRERYAERVTATGFLALSRRFGFDSEYYHHLTVQDTLDTIGQATLGLSLGCARCHDHKFDPISMQDYYALYGIFESTRYAFPGSEQKGKLRAMVPLAPPEEAQPRWREYDRRIAALAGKIARRKQPAPSAVLRSLHDPDGDFEIQKDAAGGSYGVLVPPWHWEGKLSATAAAQSPFKNLYPAGRFGAHIAGGDRDYWLAQTLYPRQTRTNDAGLHVNLDFRVGAADNKATGYHRFWIGTGTNLPVVELLLSAAGVAVRTEGQTRHVADLKPQQWYNLQLTVDLKKGSFSGRVGRPEETTPLTEHSITVNWAGTIDYVQLDSSARDGAALPVLEIDNFGFQSTPFAAVSTKVPVLVADNDVDFEAMEGELQKLIGTDGDLEWQKEGTPPAKPWNAGPNSVVKLSGAAQSPFRNVFPAGKLGVRMPNRGEYDGLGLTLDTPWKASGTERLHVAFDFRCAEQAAGGEGSWRYHLGHGSSSAAVELQFNGSEFFTRSGTTYDPVAPLRPGEWHQVQLTLNLQEKTYIGTLATLHSNTSFRGTFATGWDGVIDYTFIDGRGHRPGVRPALEADNLAFSVTPFAPLDQRLPEESHRAQETRRARVTALQQQLAALGQDVAKEIKELTTLLVEGPGEMAYGVVEGTPHDARLQLRGEPERPREIVPRGFIPSLGGGPLPPGIEGSGRLELARWLTQTNSTLAARVMVNRLWQYHFGRGLVSTANDFGVRGQRPTHPELLDHLATQFIRSGWSVKAMHRLILLSATYQQASAGGPSEAHPPGANRPSAETLRTDYAGFSRRRLSAEELRDAILAISGELDRTPARGHPFPSPVTAAYSQHVPFSATYDHNRRSLYLMTQRIKRHPFLALFDGPDPNASTADRRVTTVPTQALFFLNSPFVHEKADKMAQRLRSGVTDESRQIEQVWRLTIGRVPTPAERAEATEFLNHYRAELGAAAADSSSSSSASSNDPDRIALAAYIRVLFGSNEFLHVD